MPVCDRVATGEVELKAEASALIVRLMKSRAVNRVQLAMRLGQTAPHLSHLLAGDRNMTLETIARLAHTLGYRITLHAAEIDAPERSWWLGRLHIGSGVGQWQVLDSDTPPPAAMQPSHWEIVRVRALP